MWEEIAIGCVLGVTGGRVLEASLTWLRQGSDPEYGRRAGFATCIHSSIFTLTLVLLATPRIPLVWNSTPLLAVTGLVVLLASAPGIAMYQQRIERAKDA